MKNTILIIDDEVHMCETLKEILTGKDFNVLVSCNAKDALNIIRSEPVHAVVTDVRMPGMDGIQFLGEIKKNHTSIPVIIITAYGNMKMAVDAMKRGAFDYLAKPFDPEELLLTVQKALEFENLVLENVVLKAEMQSRYRISDLIGEAPEMRKLKNTIAKVAEADSTVLIEGESGTGKELVAHSLHYHSRRLARPFVVVNCAAFTETLLESELFGHEKGAFTGADEQKKGKFEIASGGTLYLDEIGDMSMSLQSKILRVIQDQAFFRVGGTDPVNTDVRILSATNKDLNEKIVKGEFREDLFFRLNVINLKIPPLRKRQDDIPLLAKAFLEEMIKKFPGRERFVISDKCMQKLKEYRWPGNVRELRNLLERTVIMGDEEEILTVVQQRVSRGYEMLLEKPYNEAIDSFRKMLILKTLEETKWRIRKAALRLGISHQTLSYQMENLGIKEDM